MSENPEKNRSVRDLATPAQWRNLAILSVLATVLVTVFALVIVANSTDILQRGPQGKTGAVGKKGPSGPKGNKGQPGKRGAKGEEGPVGDAGESGASFTVPACTYDRDYYFENNVEWCPNWD